jgi:hypothetical protein
VTWARFRVRSGVRPSPCSAGGSVILSGLPVTCQYWRGYRPGEWGPRVDTVTLILTALAAGAALGVKDTASQAVKDAYGSLKALVHRRLAGRGDGELALARYEEAPDTWEAPLAKELTATGAGDDARLVAAAQALMALADAAGSQAGKYAVQVHGGQGVQVGDHNTQDNTFGTAPDR